MDINNVIKWIFRAIWVVLLWRVLTLPPSSARSDSTIGLIIVTGIFFLVGNDKPKKKD